MTRTAHIYCSGDKIDKNEMDRACSTYGGKKRHIKGPLGRIRHRWEYNIKFCLQELGREAWTGSRWFRIGTGGGHL